MRLLQKVNYTKESGICYILLGFCEANLVAESPFFCYDLSMSDSPKQIENPIATPSGERTPLPLPPQVKAANVVSHESDAIMNEIKQIHTDGMVKPAAEAVPTTPSPKPNTEPDKKFGAEQPRRYSGIKEFLIEEGKEKNAA